MENYNSNNVLDSKLLYVSMTRAIHNLIVLYNNELTNVDIGKKYGIDYRTLTNIWRKLNLLQKILI